MGGKIGRDDPASEFYYEISPNPEEVRKKVGRGVIRFDQFSKY